MEGDGGRALGLARDRGPVGVEPHDARGGGAGRRIEGVRRQPVEQPLLASPARRAPASASMNDSRSAG